LGYETRIDLYNVQVRSDELKSVKREIAAVADGAGESHWMVGLLKLERDGSLSWNESSRGKWKKHEAFIEWLAKRCERGFVAFWSCERDGAAWAYEFDGSGGYKECSARRVSALKGAATRIKPAAAPTAIRNTSRPVASPKALLKAVKKGASRMAEVDTNEGTALSDGREDRGILEKYLAELKAIRDSGGGVKETSYYPALSNLFNAAGAALKPKVRCVMNLRNLGDGMPDGGLFTADQFRSQSEGAAKSSQLPARGAIEAKGTKPDVKAIAATQQVKDYLNTYGIVIVSNLREFLIVERGPNGLPVEREAFALADDESDFWQRKAAHPHGTAVLKGGPFAEFIKRACLHAAPLNSPKDVAWFLASYARDALARVERQKELPALQNVRAALEEALGMKFTDEKGEHFFRSTLVQTLFYGVFSAWVRWHKDRPGPAAKFDWRTAEWSLHVPFIRTLYRQVAEPNQLGRLGLVETLDWAAGVLNRVDRGEFFNRFEDEHAVQYFYEPFLEAYDPELRKALGVWYTPREIVKYQVARVDTVLREELKLDGGLANPNVIVLDPCCGTGAYLVEVLHSIAATLRERGGDALAASDLKKAAIERVFGFEIMPAPFVVSHLQLGLMLQSQGAPLSSNERVGVYLTNALTGWQPPKGAKQRLLFAEMEDERDAAEHVKRDKKILVVLGNPPYNAFAGVSPDEEQGLVEPYKAGLNKPAAADGWGIKKFNLDDLYVRFFRLAERRIAEMSGKGVVSFISNFSYLGDPSFVVMRQRFLAEFDKLWLDCLNGDSRETGKLTPDGKPDPSIFSTDYNREGIRVGTAVCVVVRKAEREKKPTVRFRHFWGVTKRADLVDSLNAEDIDAAYTLADPRPENRLSFRPEDVAAQYTEWPKIVDLCGDHIFATISEDRRKSLFSTEREVVCERLTAYFDSTIVWDELKRIVPGLTNDVPRFDAKAARASVLKKESYDEARVVRYALRPFDVQWAYYCPVRPLWREPRPEYWQAFQTCKRWLIGRFKQAKDPEGHSLTFSATLCDYHMMAPNATAIPFEVPTSNEAGGLFQEGSARAIRANLSKPARAYLAKLGIKDPDADAKTAGLIWMHALAVGYSPAYLTENADGIRRDWPRVPLPGSRKALEASAALGEQVAALLDTEAEAPGVTSGKIGPVFKTIGLITKVGGGQLDAASGDLAVTAGWGHKGKEGVTMPGKGRTQERAYGEDEAKAIEAEAAARGLSAKDARLLLGETTCDIYLNGAAYWRNIPLNVWEYYIGGYQVIKKWLSYREEGGLGRALKPEEAREVMNMARRIAAIILLQPKLDENYRVVAATAFNWSSQ
jgi:Type ISP C-terminal specificity domain/N-6 DNA Methylase